MGRDQSNVREKKKQTDFQKKKGRNNRIDRIVMPFIKSCNSVDWMQRGGETEGGRKKRKRDKKKKRENQVGL